MASTTRHVTLITLVASAAFPPPAPANQAKQMAALHALTAVRPTARPSVPVCPARTLPHAAALRFPPNSLSPLGASVLHAARPALCPTCRGAQGVTLSGTGRRLVNNAGLLVGTATVARVSDAFMDNFLQLPADALAVMNSEFEFE